MSSKNEEWPNLVSESQSLLFGTCKTCAKTFPLVCLRVCACCYGVDDSAGISFSPSLFAVSDSIFMYALPDLHALAKKKLLAEGDAAKVVNFPIKTKDFLDVVMRNRAALEKHFGPGDSKLYGTALFLAREEINKLDNGKEVILESELVAYDDKHSKSELVYGISKSE